MNKSVRGEPWERLPAEDYDEQTASLRDYVGIVMQSWKLVLFIVALAGLIGLYIAWTLPPVYQTNALIQIEDKPGNSLGAKLDSLNSMSEMLGGQSPGEAEIEILTSRSVVREAAKELKLAISAAPHYFGGIGAAMARAYGRQARPARPPLSNLSRYAWGGERILVSRLDVPRELEGQELVLVTGENGAFWLQGPKGNRLLQGQVGKAAGGWNARGAHMGAYVADLKARPGTEILLTKAPMQTAVGRLQDDLVVTEQGSDSGILNLTLNGPSPQAAAARLNAIANAYLRQNVTRQSAEARKTLKFVNSQLPKLRGNVNVSDAALREYQAKQGTVDLSMEARGLLNKLTNIQSHISELSLRRTELMRVYTAHHPLVETLDSKRERLRARVARAEQQLKKLPEVQSDFLKLSRNTRVANKLYLLLMNRGQQLKVVQAGATGYVRIIDHAIRPLLPSGPNRVGILAVAVFLGFMCAISLLLLRRALVRTLETPDPIERKLGIPVYATIPHSKHQSELHRAKRKHVKPGGVPDILARSASNDNAIESLRSLRTSLQFALIQTENNVVTITGPTPGLGKTFVAVNLAFLLGDIDKRVLLIDGDMRRGHVHKYLGLPRSPGLSEVIAGSCDLKQAVHVVEDGKVDFLSTGTLPPNPSELLVNDGFARLVEAASQHYDMVLFDTPPVLNLTDGIIIARQSGTTFLVARGQTSTLHDVELCAKRLQQSDIKISGVIFNDLRVSTAKYGYGKYGYYAYEYKPSKAEA